MSASAKMSDAELAARLHAELNGGPEHGDDPMPAASHAPPQHHHVHSKGAAGVRLADADFNRMPHVGGDLDTRDLK